MSQWPSEGAFVLPVREGPETVHITIDDREVEVPNGELLIRAAQEHGVYIPRFCWHERMKPVGMCRMCLVEIEGHARPPDRVHDARVRRDGRAAPRTRVCARRRTACSSSC